MTGAQSGELRVRKSDGSGEIALVAVSARKRAPAVLRWAFLLFVFTIPFEAADMVFAIGERSVTKVAGLLFFGAYILSLAFSSGRVRLPGGSAALGWFLLYVAIFSVRGIFVPVDLLGDLLGRILTLIQLLVLFWLASELLLKDQQIWKQVLLTYVIASAVLALGVIFQLPDFHAVAEDGRVSGLRENPNALAIQMALASAMVVGLHLSMPYRSVLKRMFFLALLLPFLMVMVNSGSRSGLLAYLAGYSIYGLFLLRTNRRFAAVGLASVGIAAAVYMLFTNPEFLDRWYRYYYEGDMAGREEIFPLAFKVFLERPLFGWSVQGTYEFGVRSGEWEPWDAHNLVLHLIVEGGLVGAIPFLLGFLFCGRAAWDARKGRFGVLPLALFSIGAVSTLSGNPIVWKPLWLVLALCQAAASSMVERSIRFYASVANGEVKRGYIAAPSPSTGKSVFARK